MNILLELIIAFGTGALFGVGMTCCIVMAGRTDREMEQAELEKFFEDNLIEENIDDGTDVS